MGLNKVDCWKSLNIRGIPGQLEKFQCRPALSNIKYLDLLKDASDIHRFPTLHMVETDFLLENL